MALAGTARIPSAPRMWLAGTEGVQLTHKNVAALRTLFAVASSLEQSLRDGWHIVLGTINCLDCILATPRTVSAPQVSSQARPSGQQASMMERSPHVHPGGRLLRQNTEYLPSLLVSVSVQDGGQHAMSGPTPSDLAALSSAANHVFKSTANMSGESVVGLLAALHDVSAASLSSAAMQPGTVK